MKRHLMSAVVTMGILFTGIAGPANAETTTEHRREYTSRDTNPCTGDVGTTTNLANEVLHLSEDATERVHFTFTSTGTLRFDPDDLDAETFSGRSTTRVNGSFVDDEPQVFSFAVIARVTGSRGTTLHLAYHEHVTVGPDGSVRVEFSRLSCR